MLEGDNIRVQNVKGLTDIELEKIKAFLQGAVCCWCLSHKGKWFMAKDLIADHKWENYPLDMFYVLVIRIKEKTINMLLIRHPKMQVRY